MVQGAATVRAASLDTVSGGTAEGKDHVCAHTLGSSRLEISEVTASWWESEPAVLVLSTAGPEGKPFSLHTSTEYIEITLLCFHWGFPNTSLGSRSMTEQKNAISPILQIGVE